MPVMRSRNEIPTIDVNLVTIKMGDYEFGFDTSNQIEVEPQMEEAEATRLMIKGKLKAQKPQKSTLTGNTITMHDNVFNPELVRALQGGQIEYEEGTNKVVSYTPPLAGEDFTPEPFSLCVYTAQYDAAGLIVNYEKIEYPNCQGQPVAFSSEDDAFRAPEYTINSAPKSDEPPYRITYVDSLPELQEPQPPTEGAGGIPGVGGAPVATVKGTGQLLGIDVSTLGEFSIEGNEIKGKANKVSWERFSKNKEEQNGYYLPLTVEPWEGTKCYSNYSGKDKAVELRDDGDIVFIIGVDDIRVNEIHVAPKDGEEKVYTVSVSKNS